MLSLETLLFNVNKNKSRKNFVTHFGPSQKAIECKTAIDQLNEKYSKSYYMERDGKSFSIQGHREFGQISRRDGILGTDVSLTIDMRDIKKAGSEHTIKMIIDNEQNWVVFSLTKMKDIGLIDINDSKRFRSKDGKICRFCVWDMAELNDMILYRSNGFNN